MNKAYLLIGGNMGDRLANLQEAIIKIGAHAGTIEKISSIYETAAWGNTQQEAFLNQALLIDTIHSASQLMSILLDIEIKLGRIRSIPMGPRTIDIDIIYFNDDRIETKELTIPHPSMFKRNFVLIPLVEIAPNYLHPILNKSNSALLSACADDCLVHKKINF
jgi:2-amino-4-hydroxy-6-hydroxymethyldihydropteridine diphosphokinase